MSIIAIGLLAWLLLGAISTVFFVSAAIVASRFDEANQTVQEGRVRG